MGRPPQFERVEVAVGQQQDVRRHAAAGVRGGGLKASGEQQAEQKVRREFAVPCGLVAAGDTALEQAGGNEGAESVQVRVVGEAECRISHGCAGVEE